MTSSPPTRPDTDGPPLPTGPRRISLAARSLADSGAELSRSRRPKTARSNSTNPPATRFGERVTPVNATTGLSSTHARTTTFTQGQCRCTNTNVTSPSENNKTAV